jgi:dTMP kinase
MVEWAGKLIAFEGLDQSGKETQWRRLREHLERGGHRVEALAFPDYQTPIAQEIARALRGDREYAPDVLQLLFIANRYEFKPRIGEWLAGGRIVLCDRYLASSVAYGEASGLDPDWLFDVQRHLPQPDLTILLDIEPGSALGRKRVDRDRFERDLALLERVRTSYARLADRPAWVRVDGEAPVDEVEAAVLRAVRARLGLP